MQKKSFFAVLFMLTVMGFIFPQEAKNALLIANGAYTGEAAPLPCPIPEAAALKIALETIGFKVTVVENADHETMHNALVAFGETTKAEGGIAFFHYGGHAVQVDGENYLIPVDAKIENANSFKFHCVNVNEIVGNIHGKANIIILDSCRDNPFTKTRGAAARGLAAVTASSKNSIIIAYSAAAGETAADGVFTPALTKRIIEKDRPLTEVLIDVRNDVLAATDDKQRPFDYSALREPIYLAGRTGEALARKGTIHISSDVKGEVYLDSEPKGSVREDGTFEIKVQNGSYILEVKAEFFTFKTKVTVKGEQETPVKVKTGILELYSEIAGELYINGKSFGPVKENEKRTISKLLGLCKVELRTGEKTEKKETTIKANESAFILIKKPEEPAVKTQKQTENAAKSKEFYAPGLSIGYSFSHFTASNIASFNARSGVDIKLDPARFALGAFDLKILCFGYSYSRAVITSKNDEKKETLNYHEFNFIPIKLGCNLGWFFFHLGAGPALLWEKASHLELILKNPASAVKVGFIIPIDLGIKFADFMGLYAEYKPAIVPIEGSAFVKHSLNVGVSFHLPSYF